MSEERVHELLYSCDSRTELCEMIARLEDENAKLQASNEVIAEDHAALCEHNVKLQNDAELLREMLQAKSQEKRALMSENAKMQKLIRIMHGELVSCEECGYVCGGHKFDSYVRELGIEAD